MKLDRDSGFKIITGLLEHGEAERLSSSKKMHSYLPGGRETLDGLNYQSQHLQHEGDIVLRASNSRFFRVLDPITTETLSESVRNRALVAEGRYL